MDNRHASDCALHNGPAMMPLPCDCGAEPGRKPEAYGSEVPMTANRAWLNLGGSISLIVGYLEALQAGDEVAGAYHERLNKHYIPMLIRDRDQFNALWNVARDNPTRESVGKEE